MPKVFVGEPFSVSLISGMEKFYAYEGNFTIFYRNFCLTVSKNFIGEPFHVSPKFWYRKILWIRGEGGNITIFGHNFISPTVPKVFVGEPFSVSLISGMEKFYAYAGIFTFSRKNLFSHTTEKLRRVTLLVSQNFWYRKKIWIRVEDRGSITIFRQKSSVTVPKIFVGEPLSALIIYGIEKFHSYEWNITNFFGNVLSHSTERNCWGNVLCFTMILVSKKLMDKRGGGGGREYHDFRSQLFSLTVPKIFVGEPFSVSLISCMENFMPKRGISLETFVLQYQKTS